jgi:hypothetical protein
MRKWFKVVSLAPCALLLLALSACKSGGSTPADSLPGLSGSWDWMLHYSDGTDTGFTMLLSSAGSGEYTASVNGDSVGSVSFNGVKVVWSWNRSNGSAVATGTYRSSPEGWDGDGVDSFTNGTVDHYTFVVNRH